VKQRRIQSADLALSPVWLIVAVVYVGSTLWTAVLSFTSSRSLPTYSFIGLAQYRRLWLGARWPASLIHLLFFGAGLLAASMALGVLLAILLDRAKGMAGLFRSIFLYPAAVSFVVTGLVWQWMMNPEFGLSGVLRLAGVSGIHLDWPSHPDTVILALVVAGAWQSAGLVMAIVFASLRGINPEIWSAAQVDGIPTWRIYAFIMLPMIRPALATTVLLISVSIVKVYDLVVAFTQGGPGTSSDMPSLYIMDYLFLRQNIALACAASTSLLGLIAVAVLLLQLAQRGLSIRARLAR
jgi:glucose/mannose transport system permease protein